MSDLLRALGFLVAIGQTVASAESEAPDLSAVCAIESSEEDERSTFRIALLVSNGSDEELFDVEPGRLDATSTGTAVLFVQVYPSTLPVLAAGANAAFVWSGRPFGDGSVSVRTSLSARRADGSYARIESIDCREMPIGNPDLTPPTRHRTPHQPRTPLPTPRQCPADCDRNGTVEIHELVTAIEIAMGRGDLSACPVADVNGNSQIDVAELTEAVRTSLVGCALP